MPSHNNAPLNIAIAVSIKNLLSNGTLHISAVIPITNNILNILLPTILPIAIPALPFLAAATDVTSSGSDVQNATMVSPMNLSLMPKNLAIQDAPLTAKSLPLTTITPPIIIKRRHFHTGISLISPSS